MFEAIQKIAPWMSGLPTVPKFVLTLAWSLLTFVFFYVVWVPAAKTEIYDLPEVKAAYERMARVLKRISIDSSDKVLVDGHEVDYPQYYGKLASIAEFVKQHPGDVVGAYEKVWENGGLNRSFTTDTEAFEAVVSGFAISYYEASRPKAQKTSAE